MALPGQSVRHRFMLLIALVAIPLAFFDIYLASQGKQRRTVQVSRDLSRTSNAVVEKVSGLIDASNELLTGLSTAKEIKGGDVAACNRMLKEVGARYTKYTNFSMVDREKYLVCSSGPLDKPLFLAKSPNINEAFETGKFAVSPFKFGVLTGKPILVFSEPFFDKEGQMLGTINNGLSLTWLGEYLKTINKLEGEHILVFDGKGTVLASFPVDEYEIGSRLNETDLTSKAYRIGNGTSTFLHNKNERMLAAFATFPRIPNGAHVVSFSSLDDLQSDISRELYQRLLILGLLVFGSLVLGWIGARVLLLNPIDRLIASSLALSRGNLKARSDVPHEAGELGRLGVAFNQMAEALDVRTEALANAKKEAETANKAKSEFLASMSHELRTPLNAILGFAQMMELDPSSPLSQTQKAHVESILAGGQHLLDLVNEVLDLARIEADQINLALEEVDAFEEIKNAVALTVPLAKKRNIEIVDDCACISSKLIRTDPLRLKQILLNLLSNAVRYNRTDGTISVVCRNADDDFVRISVTDTGYGIPDEDRHGIFQMFHRLGADPMITREGTGIGLTVTKLLVERMAGRIGFESVEGQGSTFWVELPLASNEDVIIWSDFLRVGLDPMDRDHQVIISLLNEVTRGKANDVDLDDVIQELLDFTQHHFQREDTIMTICSYPKQSEHQESHRNILKRVIGLAEQWHQDRSQYILKQFHGLLKDWLMGHILTTDAELAAFAKGKGREIKDALKDVK